ncbi:cytochrome c/c1 heme-lyase [Russula vinacea]|nr:cytochrome c/c1 heme-lyase [Russula vinacea]
MGQTASSTLHPASSSSAAGCPVDHSAAKHPQAARSSSSLASCPVDHSSTARSSSSAPPAQCPVQQPEAIDLRNHLPVLTQERAPSQTQDLPTERTASSIPRDAAGHWEYPSPQQFYNALVRKGWETPENEIETMVQIHNFLNEKAWEEVQKWEAQVNKDEQLQLVRFKGRPGELSPKARFWLAAGWLLPDRFKIRYVIDYYGAPSLPDGSPVFSLDVRPALDSFGSLSMRVRAATRGAWEKVATEARHA